MVLDASALLAMLFDEPDAHLFEEAIGTSGRTVMSPVNLWEALVRARVVRGPSGSLLIEELLNESRVEIVPVTAEHARTAAEAFALYGRHAKARLNLGDCFAYALARAENAPLLHKDEGFNLTDVRSAL